MPDEYTTWPTKNFPDGTPRPYPQENTKNLTGPEANDHFFYDPLNQRSGAKFANFVGYGTARTLAQVLLGLSGSEE